jgi:hypothetical protein
MGWKQHSSRRTVFSGPHLVGNYVQGQRLWRRGLPTRPCHPRILFLCLCDCACGMAFRRGGPPVGSYGDTCHCHVQVLAAVVQVC